MDTPLVWRLGPLAVIIFHPKMMEVTLKCPNQPTALVKFMGTRVIHPQEACLVESQLYELPPLRHVHVRPWLLQAPALGLSEDVMSHVRSRVMAHPDIEKIAADAPRLLHSAEDPLQPVLTQSLPQEILWGLGLTLLCGFGLCTSVMAFRRLRKECRAFQALRALSAVTTSPMSERTVPRPIRRSRLEGGSRTLRRRNSCPSCLDPMLDCPDAHLKIRSPSSVEWSANRSLLQPEVVSPKKLVREASPCAQPVGTHISIA